MFDFCNKKGLVAIFEKRKIERISIKAVNKEKQSRLQSKADDSHKVE